MLQDLAASGKGATVELGQIRNPFLVVAPPAAAATAAEPDAAAEPETDKLAEIISRLTLDATFIQGRDQLAIIDGRIYHKGQSLALPGDPEKTQPVVVLFVKPTGVLLRGNGKNYLLGYPERLGKKPDAGADDSSQADPAALDPAGQAAMFQRLLNSPLGALGKSLIGNAVPTGPSAGRRPGSRAKASGTRPPGPASP